MPSSTALRFSRWCGCQTFAAHGTTVYVTALRIENAEKIANKIEAAGDTEIAAQVDTLNAKAVHAHLDDLVSKVTTSISPQPDQ